MCIPSIKLSHVSDVESHSALYENSTFRTVTHCTCKVTLKDGRVWTHSYTDIDPAFEIFNEVINAKNPHHQVDKAKEKAALRFLKSIF